MERAIAKKLARPQHYPPCGVLGRQVESAIAKSWLQMASRQNHAFNVRTVLCINPHEIGQQFLGCPGILGQRNAMLKILAGGCYISLSKSLEGNLKF